MQFRGWELLDHRPGALQPPVAPGQHLRGEAREVVLWRHRLQRLNQAKAHPDGGAKLGAGQQGGQRLIGIKPGPPGGGHQRPQALVIGQGGLQAERHAPQKHIKVARRPQRRGHGLEPGIKAAQRTGRHMRHHRWEEHLQHRTHPPDGHAGLVHAQRRRIGAALRRVAHQPGQPLAQGEGQGRGG